MACTRVCLLVAHRILRVRPCTLQLTLSLRLHQMNRLFFRSIFCPSVVHSPSRRSALPRVVMADNAPRPTGMGHAQLRDWINQWGSAWAFLGLEPGSSMTDVMKAFKKKALVLHPDKVPDSEKEDATLRMSALGNAKESHLLPRRHRLSLSRSLRADPALPRPRLRHHRRVHRRVLRGMTGLVLPLLRLHRQILLRAIHGTRRVKARAPGDKREGTSGRTPMATCGKRCPTCPTSPRTTLRAMAAGIWTRTPPVLKLTDISG